MNSIEQVFIDKQELTAIFPLFTLTRLVDEGATKTYWQFGEKTSTLVLSNNFVCFSFAIPLQTGIQTSKMYEIDFNKIMQVLQALHKDDALNEAGAIHILLQPDKLIFEDTTRKRIKTKLSATQLSDSVAEAEYSLLQRLQDKFFGDGSYTIYATPTFRTSLKTMLTGITNISSRNNAVLLGQTDMLYSDIAQIYSFPAKDDEFYTDGQATLLHKTTIQLILAIADLIHTIYKDDAPAILQFKASPIQAGKTHSYYLMFQYGTLSLTMSQHVPYLDLPTDAQLADIAPQKDDPDAIRFTVMADALIDELKIFSNIADTDAKRWGVVTMSANADVPNKIHLSLYDYSAEIDTDFVVYNMNMPADCKAYSFLVPAKVIETFLRAQGIVPVDWAVVPIESNQGPKSIGFSITNTTSGHQAIFAKFQNATVNGTA